jgi:hypothetical protein
MIGVLVIIFIAAVGAVLGLEWRKPRSWPSRIGIALAGAATTLLLAVALLMGGLWLVFHEEEPPTLSELTKNFRSRAQQLDQLRLMSDQDTEFWRISPTFLTPAWGAVPIPKPTVPAPVLPDGRWSEYKTAFKKAGIAEGFQRDATGNIFFMAGAEGLLNRGHATGYLYCVDPGSAASANSQFEPCTLSPQNEGHREYSAEPRVEAYTFKRVADHWYVFDQGPS